MVRSSCALAGPVASLALLAALPAQAACGYDVVRGRFVDCRTNVRVWDGVTDWRIQYQSGTGGPPHAVFDPVGNRMLAIHGYLIQEWAGGRWRDLPNHRVELYSALRTWDVARNRLVVCTGNALWEWDDRGSYGPLGSLPANTTCSAIGFDPATGQTLLLCSSRTGVETWLWNGAVLSQAALGGPVVVRFLVGDPARGRLVAVPGLGDTWEWDGVAWQRLASSGFSGLDVRSVAFDPVRNLVLAFGHDGSGMGILGWNGAVWTQVADPFEPPTNPGLVMAYDETRDELVVLSGAITPLDQTWVWNGFSWTRRLPVAAPPARTSPAMCWDPASRRVLLFGGRDAFGALLGDTWLWDGVQWAAAAGTSPSPRASAALSASGANGPCLLFGGIDSIQELADTWEWLGTSWLQRTPTVVPPGRRSALMAHDPLRARTVLAFGTSGFVTRNDVFEWDGNDWRLAGTSPSGGGAALVFHPRLGGVMTLGAGGAFVWDGVQWTAVQVGRGGASVLDTRRGCPVGFGAGRPVYLDQPAFNWWAQEGCGGARIPGLAANGNLGIGDARFRLEVSTRVPGAPTVLVFGLTTTRRVLGAGCTWYPDLPMMAFFQPANASGNADWPLSIAVAPGIVGTDCYLQAAVLDPNAPLGFSLTNAFSTTLGYGP